MDAAKGWTLARLIFAIAGIATLSALWSAPAQAVEWKPYSKNVKGESITTKLQYGPQTITCNSKLAGATAAAASATIILSSWGNFSECSNNNGYSAFATTTVGKTSFSLVATKATGKGSGEAQIEIPNEGSVVFGIEYLLFNLCVYTATGAQSMTGGSYNASTRNLIFNESKSATFTVSGWGSEETCGAAGEEAKFSSNFGMSEPTNLEIL